MVTIDVLHAGARNISRAYKVDADLGILETRKIADMLVLAEDPLQAADHCHSIHAVIEDSELADVAASPSVHC